MAEDEHPTDSGDGEESDPEEQAGSPPEQPQESDTEQRDSETDRSDGQPDPDTGRREPESGRQEPGAEEQSSNAYRGTTDTRPRDSGGRQGSEPQPRNRGTGTQGQDQRAQPQYRGTGARGESADTRHREQPSGGQTRRGRSGGSNDGGPAARIERFGEMVVWPESIIVGVSTWLIGLFLTVIPLWWFDFSSDLNQSTLDLAIWVYVESVGGTINDGVLAVTGGAYGTLDSNAFGLGPVVHMVIPVLVLLVAGHVLAGRHINAGATKRPLESVLAGGSLAIWFTLTLFIAAIITSSDAFSVNTGEALVTTFLYTGVFASIGAAIRSRTGLTSAWGLLAGIGTFVVGFVLWYLLEDPFGDYAGVDGFSDLDGVLGYTRVLTDFVAEHGVEANEIVPAWFVVVVPLAVGAVLAYVYERRDPVAGLGEGARLGATYAVLVFLAVVGQIGAQAREFEQTFDAWPETAVNSVNILIANAPREIFLGGIVYPAVFAALGGAIGAFVYGTQYPEERSQRSPQERQQQPREPRADDSPAGQYQTGQQSPDQQYQTGQQSPNQSGSRVESGQQPPEQPSREPPDSPGQQPPEQSGREPPDSPGQQPPDTGQQPSEQPGRQPSDSPGQQPPDTGQQPPDPADQQPQQPSEGDESAGQEPEETGGESDASGEELSPGDIVGDEIGEDDSEDN
jgi:hypothetical protein